eukprot:TRINITY_DN4337_c0_g1_i1.p1 TRINITY_DN4337_c0_g1~~TRINITY_DN4337_c0_g1_i1.p1  ORF type:complete len:292 (+),score=55.98 TRINITY_DN4337_c0_g1_i1:222-1097(+)
MRSIVLTVLFMAILFACAEAWRNKHHYDEALDYDADDFDDEEEYDNHMHRHKGRRHRKNHRYQDDDSIEDDSDDDDDFIYGDDDDSLPPLNNKNHHSHHHSHHHHHHSHLEIPIGFKFTCDVYDSYAFCFQEKADSFQALRIEKGTALWDSFQKAFRASDGSGNTVLTLVNDGISIFATLGTRKRGINRSTLDPFLESFNSQATTIPKSLRLVQGNKGSFQIFSRDGGDWKKIRDATSDDTFLGSVKDATVEIRPLTNEIVYSGTSWFGGSFENKFPIISGLPTLFTILKA